MIRVILPALTLRTADGQLDTARQTAYTARARSTWADHIILNGSATGGRDDRQQLRDDVLDLWIAAGLDHRRILACCWTPSDITAAQARQLRPLIVVQDDPHTVLATAPAGAYLYSNPRFGPTLEPHHLVDTHHLAGAKLSHATPADVTALRRAAGPDAALWDGTARHLADSLTAGATGVDVTAFAALPDIALTRPASLAALQQWADQQYARLDPLGTTGRRAALLTDALTRI